MPNLLDNRKIAILWSVIEHYVETAEPVSSQMIVDAGAVDASPATIRSEMAALEEAGYLSQPYTSAGRIPTETAYRRYVAELLAQQRIPTRVRLDVVIRVIDEATSPRSMVKGIARAIAAEISQAIVVGFGQSDAYATGISYVVVQPEFHDPHVLHEFSRAIDRLDETLDQLEERVDDGPTVVLGEENPFGHSCGTVASRLRLPAGNTVTLGIVGPMRMAYEEQLGVLYGLRDAVERS